MAAAAPRTGKLVWLYPEQITERKANNRFDFGDLGELAKSIAASGIQVPLKGKKLKTTTDDGYPMYELTDGHRRLRACQRIVKKTGETSDFIPLQVEEADVTEADRIVTALVTGEAGKPRNMLEAARDIKALINLGQNQTQVAKAIGKSAVYVSDCLMLIEKASDDLIKQMQSGNILPYTALEMIKGGTDTKEIVEVVEKVAEKKQKKAAEEAVINPDKKANVKTHVSKSELEEESGKPMTVASKKKASTSAGLASVKAAGGDNSSATPKEDGTLLKLRELQAAMKAQTDARKKLLGFGAMNGLMKFITGKATAFDLMPIFFWGMDEEADARYIADVDAPADEVAESTESKPAEVAAKKGTKKAAEVAPAPSKPTKGAQTLKEKSEAAIASKKPSKKAVVAEDEPTDEDLDEIDDLSDDDDNELE